MTFLNFVLLFGVAAAAVPLIIHLLHRTKVRVIHWGAMQFLSGAIEKRSRRMQWQQWLLLAIRCAIPAFLAIAMAQPALTWVHNQIGGDGSAQQLVLIDNSLSMLAPQQTSNSDDGSSLATVADVIENAITRPVLWTDMKQDMDSIQNGSSLEARVATQFQREPVEILDQIRLALEQSDSDENTGSKPNLIVVTDCRQSQIDSISADKRRQIRSLLSNSAGSELYLLPTVPLKDEPQSVDNIAVHIDSSSDAIVGPNQVSEINFTIGNFGSQQIQDMVVDIRMQGKTQATIRLDLASAQIERRTIQVPALPQGDYVLEVFCDRNDSFAYDNRAYWTLQSIAPEKVLIIHGPNANSSNYVQFAVYPPSMNDDPDTKEPVPLPRQFEVLGPVKFDNHGELQKLLDQQPRHVVICDVPRLQDDMLRRIDEVTRAGTLMLLAGKHADVDWWNGRLLQGISNLPIQIESKQQIADQDERISFSNSGSLSSIGLTAIPDTAQSWTTKSFWPLKLLTDANNSDKSNRASEAANAQQSVLEVLAKGREDRAMLILAKSEQRQCLLSAHDLDPEGASLPLSEAFLPLIQSFYQNNLRMRLDDRNLSSGDELPEAINGVTTKLNWQMGLIQHEQAEKYRKQNHGETSTLRTFAPGVFSSIRDVSDGQWEVHYATVQVPWAESALQIAGRESVSGFAADIGAKLFEPGRIEKTESILIDEESKGQNRWNIWRYVLMFLLVFLFAELLLQRHLARRLA